MARQMATITMSNEEHAYVKALADAAGESLAAVAREYLFDNLDDLRARAKQAQDKMRGLPHGVTDAQVEEAAIMLVHDINQRNVISVPTGDLFGARSKALYRLLAAVWQEKPDKAAQAFLKSIEGRVGAARKQLDDADITRPNPAPGGLDLPPPPLTRTRNYPPRAGKLGRK